MKLKLFVYTVLLSLFLANTSVKAQTQWQVLVDSAYTAFDEGRYDRAAYWSKKTIELEPTNASAYYFLSRALYLGKHPAPALNAIEKAIELSPNKASYFYLKSSIHHQLYDFKKRLIALRRAHVLDLSDVNTTSMLADAEFQLYQFKNARKLYEDLLDQYDQLDSYYQNRMMKKLVKLYRLTGDSQKEIQIAHRFIQQHLQSLQEVSDDSNKLVHISEIMLTYSNIAKFDSVDYYIKKGLNIDKNNLILRYYEANLYHRTDQYDKALILFRELQLLYPNVPDIDINIIYNLVFTNQFEKAIQYANELALVYPTFPNIYGNKGIAQLKLKQYEQAKATFDEALRLQPNNPWVFRWLGTLYLEQGDQQKACEYFQKAEGLGYTLLYYRNDLTPLLEQHCN